MADTYSNNEVDEAIDKVRNNTPAVITWGWDDLTNSIVGKNLTGVVGKVDTNWEESAIIFQHGGSLSAVNDRITMNLQKMHSVKADSELRLHVHWEQDSADAVIWSVQYRIQGNGAAKTTAWSTPENFTSNSTNNVFPYTSGTLNQITELAKIDWSAVILSSTVQIRVARTDAVDKTADGHVLVTFIDAHAQFDQNGSIDEYSKAGS